MKTVLLLLFFSGILAASFACGIFLGIKTGKENALITQVLTLREVTKVIHHLDAQCGNQRQRTRRPV
jgi:hypothetical protein